MKIFTMSSPPAQTCSHQFNTFSRRFCRNCVRSGTKKI